MTKLTHENPVAFITGASVRIGSSIARKLHSHGYDLILHYRNSAEKAQQQADELLASRPDSVRLVRGHLDRLEDLNCIIRDIVDPASNFSGRLDVLVNNASAFYPTPIRQATQDQWDDLVNTNLRAPFLLAQGFADVLSEHQGNIINITDIHGDRPLANHIIYSMTKAGLISLTRSLAKELAPAVRTNAISPGAILWPEREENDTEFHAKVLAQVPLGRLGAVENISDTVWYLINNDYVNGQVIAMDGGKSIN